MSRVDAATILERARALVATESRRDATDESDKGRSAVVASVASIACVAAPVDGVDPSLTLLRVALNSYVAGGQGPALRATFGRWTVASGFAYENRGGVAVALDESGRVVAAIDTHAPATVTQHRSTRLRTLRRAHTHGWARVGGNWTCVRDFYEPGGAPGTGCGQIWDEADHP